MGLVNDWTETKGADGVVKNLVPAADFNCRKMVAWLCCLLMRHIIILITPCFVRALCTLGLKTFKIGLLNPVPYEFVVSATNIH